MIVQWLRPGDDARREVIAAAIAVLMSIAIGSALMLVMGREPGAVWLEMARCAGDPFHLGQIFYKATGLALTGLGVALALDAGLFNIGAEGQLTAGVLVCALTSTALPAQTPAIVAIPICLLAAAAGGAVIGGSIGALRVYRGAHEVISSIMMNGIVAGLALWIGNVVLFQGGTTRGGTIIEGARIPQLGLGGSALNASVFLSMIAVGAMWWLRARTTWGLAWRAVGRDAACALNVGISAARAQLIAMIVSGALCGLTAANFVMGHRHAFEEGLGRNTGLLGISVALLGRLHPLGVAFAALGLAYLTEGGVAAGDLVPKELSEMLQGIVVLAVAGASAWVRRTQAVA
ncbi:MAG: ABC transporter permease [Kofleriaceae bacterium]